MEYESLAPWWPEPDGVVAEPSELPIFSPPPSINLYFAGLGSMLDEDQEELQAGEGSLNKGSVEEMGSTTSEDLGAVMNDQGNAGNKGCRNLVSERNRRKRINQQLIALRSLVPNMSKMDKRSILIDAAKYLQNLHSEIEQVKREIEEQNENSHEQPHLRSDNVIIQPLDHEEASPHLAQHHIYKVETNEINDRMLSVKLVFRNFRGALLKVQRMIESMGPTVTHTWSHIIDTDQMTTTSYLNYKKLENIGAEMLKEQVTKAAINMGFEIDLDD